MTTIRKNLKHETRRGAVAVEMAVCAPFLVLIFFGIAEFGSILSARNTMIQAARAGARELAIQGATEEEAIAIATNFLSASHVNGAVISAQNAYAGSGDDALSRQVWVDIQLPVDNASIIGDALGLFPEESTLSVRATMRKEGELLPPPAS